MKLIVAGGIVGIGLGAVVGGTVGYKVGVYSAWRLVTMQLGKAAE